jgi:hypothetical protein
MKPRISPIATDAQAQTEALKSQPFHTKTAKGAKPRRFFAEAIAVTISVHPWLKKVGSLRYLCPFDRLRASDLGVKRIEISTVKNSRLFAPALRSFSEVGFIRGLRKKFLFPCVPWSITTEFL